MSPDDSKELEIQPALTAEEWVNFEGRRGRLPRLPEIVRAEWGSPPITILANTTHQAAAVALFGRPEGFTHEMLNALDDAIRAARLVEEAADALRLHDEDDLEGEPIYTVADVLEQIATRISHLLPPRTEG